jgi:FixJ family two-component response regulator
VRELEAYFFTKSATSRVHVHHGDVRTCEILCATLRVEGFEVAFSADRPAYFLALEKHQPDVIVLGPDVGDDKISFLLQKTRIRWRGIPIVALISKVDIDETLDVIRRGATDVIGPVIDSQRFIRGVREAIAADLVVRSGVLPLPTHEKELMGFKVLSRRERQVVQLIVSGLSNREAADRLGIDLRTVESHRYHAQQKLGSKNLADLTRMVLLGGSTAQLVNDPVPAGWARAEDESKF